MLNWRHEAAAPHMLVVREAHRCIHRHARNALRLQEVGNLSHRIFADESFHRRIELIGVGAPVKVIEPIRRVEHWVMIFPES